MTNHNTTPALMIASLRALRYDVNYRNLPALLDQYLTLRDLGHSRLAAFRISAWMTQ